MLTTSAHSVPSGADRYGQPAWRRLVAVVLIALLSPVPALLAFWADANSDGMPDSWVDPASGHVFTLAELDAFSDDIDGDGLANAQELALGTDPFVADPDGDGLWDAFDPLPLDSSNSSQANGIVWGAFAMDDADGDGIPNFTDADPHGTGGPAVDPDGDGDGIPDLIDPAPGDPYNISPANGFPWLGDALADADGDGVVNFHDWYPYDASRWDEVTDGDNDGIPDGSDPSPGDSSNYSFANGISWGADVFGDSDADGVFNFYDAYPYDSGNGYVPSEPDADGDGIPDSSDPSPWDYYNFSAANGVSWQGDARGDADSDGISNFYDQFPNDYYNGNVPVFDQDGDGIPDGEDPAPSDSTNLSPVNGGLWYTAALADADGDGNPNFTDPWPYDPTNGNLPPEWNSPTADTDADGIPNAQDPALADPLNFSIYNGTSWYADAVGDVDGDGIVNFQDAYPYDYYNGSYAGPDSDGDGVPDSQDPYPYDATNGGTGGGGDPQPEPDSDGDGRPDSQDPYPNDPYDNADFDQDGIPDVSDPAQADANNLSPINGIEWFGDVRGDVDADGVQNFWDLEPYGPPSVDVDGDGLIDSVDPAPEDFYNSSPHNGAQWQADALGDFDGDGVPNFFDAWPDDRLNGQLDTDMDGIPDPSDPAPEDSMNYSSYNGRNWYGSEVLGDADNDGILNFFDLYPEDFYNGNPPVYDSDRDGIPDNIDPDPGSPYNSSPNNGIEWGADAFGDADGDGTVNYWDSDPYPLDTDGDGLADPVDPAPFDPANFSTINSRTWTGVSALEDLDSDGNRNFFDPEPEGGPESVFIVEKPRLVLSRSIVPLNLNFDEGKVGAGSRPVADLEDPSIISMPKAEGEIGKAVTKDLIKVELSPSCLVTPYPNPVMLVKLKVAKVGDAPGNARLHVVTQGGKSVSTVELGAECPVEVSVVGLAASASRAEIYIEGVAEGRLKLTAEFPETVLPSPFVWEGYDPLFPSGASRLAAFSLSQEFEVCGVSLVVDANRDGNLIFDGESRDITSPGNPYKFWTNSDFDDAFDQSTIFYTEFEQDDREVSSVEQEDWRRDRVACARDLEDFFRLQARVAGAGAAKLIKDGRLVIGLTWDGGSLPGQPVLKLYGHIEKEGTGAYLTEASEAQSQIANGALIRDASDSTISTIVPGRVFILPEFSLDFSKPDFVKANYLAEGCNPSSGTLKIGIYQKEGGDYVLVCEGGGVDFEIVRPSDFVERFTCGSDWRFAPTVLERHPESTQTFASPVSDCEKDYVLFVHGYNMEEFEKQRWLETTYKRLYWQGYRGRVGGFSWPCSFGKVGHLFYDISELRAWQSADFLRAHLEGLRNRGYNVHILAHSQGNVVASEALRQWAESNASSELPLISTYLASQAAYPASAYDQSAPLMASQDDQMPDVYAHYLESGGVLGTNEEIKARSSYMTPAKVSIAAAKWVNFYNPMDYALTGATILHPGWEMNQYLKPDAWMAESVITSYSYDSYHGFRRRDLLIYEQLAFPANRHQIFSFAAKPKSKALGAVLLRGAVFEESVDLSTGRFRFSREHLWHSGQFRSSLAMCNNYLATVLSKTQHDEHELK